MTPQMPHTPELLTQADVTEMWRELIRPLGWRSPRVYAVVVGDDRRPVPVMNQLDDLPPALSAEEADRLVGFLGELVARVDMPASFALLYVRPGGGRPTADDFAVCRLLYEAAHQRGVALETVHVGTDDVVTPAPMDDVVAAREADQLSSSPG
jgi:hypothetical protein